MTDYLRHFQDTLSYNNILCGLLRHGKKYELWSGTLKVMKIQSDLASEMFDQYDQWTTGCSLHQQWWHFLSVWSSQRLSSMVMTSAVINEGTCFGPTVTMVLNSNILNATMIMMAVTRMAIVWRIFPLYRPTGIPTSPLCPNQYLTFAHSSSSPSTLPSSPSPSS